MKSGRRNGSGDEKRPGCPAWMMTFGDCMSLLVTFFVMLIAFSNIEEEQLTDMLGAMRGALGAFQRFGISDVLSEAEAEAVIMVEGEDIHLRFLTINEIADAIPRLVDEMRREARQREDLIPDYMLLQMLDEGLAIVLLTRDVFHVGAAEWRENLDVLWDGIGRLLEGRANEIRITAIMSPSSTVDPDVARTVWGLGVTRAEKTARAMQARMDAMPQRFSVGVSICDQQIPDEDRLEITIMARENVMDVGTERVWSEVGL